MWTRQYTRRSEFCTVTACTGTCYTVYPSVINNKARVLAEALATLGELTLSCWRSMAVTGFPISSAGTWAVPSVELFMLNKVISLAEGFPTFRTHRDPFSSVSFLMRDTMGLSDERFSHSGHLEGHSAVWIRWCLGSLSFPYPLHIAEGFLIGDCVVLTQGSLSSSSKGLPFCCFGVGGVYTEGELPSTRRTRMQFVLGM